MAEISASKRCVRCANGDTRTPDGFHALSTGRYMRCADLPPYEEPACTVTSKQWGFSVGLMRAWLGGSWALSAEQVTLLVTDAADEIDRLTAQWEKAARLLNEFRPVTGTDEWVAVRVGALNYVLMAASPTPEVGPLVAAPESRDG